MTKKKVHKKVAPEKVISYTRQQMRDRLLGSAPKPVRKLVTLFNTPIELQQPTLRAILDAQGVTDVKERAVSMIIEYAYVPGTNELVFEEADAEMILGWPFSDDLVTVQLTIAELTGIDIAAVEKELEKDPLGEQS